MQQPQAAEAPVTCAETVPPGQFEAAHHYYPKVLNAHIHPVVRFFRSLGNQRIVQRYCHLHPEADPQAVADLLQSEPRYFRWGGADLFNVTTDQGRRQVVVIETNSSPSGQKSMPLYDESDDQSGYRALLRDSFLPQLKKRGLPKGALAVLYDKNYTETSGYAATLADLVEEPVYLVRFHENDDDPPARFEDGVLQIRTQAREWIPVRAALRYVTQRPWNRIPPTCRTFMLNPIVVCLAGGRNKLVAAKAYDIFNSKWREAGLDLRVPETIWDVGKQEVPLWVQRMGGVAVVKNPYSNAGQGVYTITSDSELRDFMELEHVYDRFIVQSLIGNSAWSSSSSSGKLYHVGTVPNRKGRIYVSDVRFMAGAGPDGFFPVAIYARRARDPLVASLAEVDRSWNMLGTNLSIKRDSGAWDSDPSRLLLMDTRDFNQLGLGVDDLIEGYLQTVMSMTAIDDMAKSLVSTKGKFKHKLFGSLNPDSVLLDEIAR